MLDFVYQTDEIFVQRKLLSVTKQAANVLPFRKKNIHFIFNLKKLSKCNKTGTVSRDITMKSLKAQSEESECYIKMLFSEYLILFQTKSLCI